MEEVTRPVQGLNKELHYVKKILFYFTTPIGLLSSGLIILMTSLSLFIFRPLHTVHDTWKWTVPHECYSRQISQEMPRSEHLVCHSIIKREYSYASGTKYHQQSSKCLANFTRQIVDREMSVPWFSRDSPAVFEGLAFFVQFHVSCTVHFVASGWLVFMPSDI